MLISTITPDGYQVGADGKWNGKSAVSKAMVQTTQYAVASNAVAAVTATATAVTTTANHNSAANTTWSVSYIGNANNMKFHKANCASVKKMADHNKVYLSSRQEAIDGGYVACKNCKP